MACDFSALNSCTMNPQGMPPISGDKGNDSQTAMGTRSTWLQIHVTENDSAILSPKDLSFTATLTSPPGTIYNLVVRESGDGDGSPNCGAGPMNGTPQGGTTQSVHHSWSDSQGIGGIDNSRWLSIEVIQMSGNDCTDPWTLDIQGHT